MPFSIDLPPKPFIAASPAIVRAASLRDLGWNEGVFPFPAFVPYVASGLSETLWDRTTGTNIGNMTLNGGLAAAFDGNSSQDSTSSAKGPEGSATCYVGKSFGSAKPISKIVLTGSNNVGFSSGGASPNITVVLRGKSGTAPSSRTDGTSLGSVVQADSNSGVITVTSSDTSTTYDHVIADITEATGSGNCFVAEMQIYIMA